MTKVESFVSGQQWILPNSFITSFSTLAAEILHTPFPIDSTPDLLIWETSRSGHFSFSEGYELIRQRLASTDWATKIWRHFIPPRYSMLAWRLLHNKLPTDDQLQRRGIPMVSVCQLCNFGYLEDLDHLFVSCTFAKHVWQWLACCFGTSLPSNGSIVDFLNLITCKPFSPQPKNLWIGGCLYVLMAIWKTRNRLRFDDKPPSLMRVFRSTKAWLRFAAPHIPGHSSGILDNNFLIGLGIQPTSRSYTASRLVLWHPPIYPWVKLNIDGLAKGNHGPAACGGVFRDSNGHYIGGFCHGLGNQTAFFAELMGVIVGIDYAFQFGWRYIWLESDSTSVLACITFSSFSPPWPLRIAWLNCLSRIRSMSFYCSHVLREGNTVADRMANLGLASSSLVWYEVPPPALSLFRRMDDLSFPYQRDT